MRWTAGVLALALACGGGDKATVKVEAVTLTDGRLSELADARTRLISTLEEDRTNGAVIAGIAEIDGLSALLYGIPVPRVFAPVATGAPGYRSWVIGKVAFELTRADKPEALAPLVSLLESLAGADLWRDWLGARIDLARGDRVAAMAKLERLSLPVAAIDRAMLRADAGDDRGAAQSLGTGMPELAAVMQAVLYAEQGSLESVSRTLAKVKSDAPRITAYRLVVDALLGLTSQRYDLTAAALDKLGKVRTLPNECWLWERIAWAHLQLGRNADRTNDHKIASISRLRCAALGKATGENHKLKLVDATLQLGLAKPEAALELVARIPSVWGRVTRAYALLELGRAAEVSGMFEMDKRTGVTRTGFEDRLVKIVLAQALAQRATGKPRDEAFATLVVLADDSADDDQRARHALGAAYYATGDLTAAKRELRRVVEETSVNRPDPFAYRTHQLLAEIAMATHDLETAGPEIERAIVIHPGNPMGYVIQARILIARGDAERALSAMAPLRKLGELIPAGKLVVAEALASIKNATPDQRAQARALVLEAVGKLPPAEVGRVAALVDPRLPSELKLPVGKLPKQGT